MRALLLPILLCCGCDEDPPPAKGPGVPELPPAPTPGSYEASDQGMRQFMLDFLAAAARGDRRSVDPWVTALTVPAYFKWFSANFHRANSFKMTNEYGGTLNELPDMIKEIRRLLGDGHTSVKVYSVRERSNPGARPLQRAFLSAWEKPAPLYSFEMRRRGHDRGPVFWSFIHVDGQFRYVGDMECLER